MTETLTIKNKGPEIVETNYFDTQNARHGVFYLSINAGTFRLLVPPSHESAIADFRTAKEVVISRGPWPEVRRKDAIEILFDDHSESPYSLQFGTEQIDRLPAVDYAGKWYDFSVWTQGANGPECVYRSKCYYRTVPAIPYLRSI